MNLRLLGVTKLSVVQDYAARQHVRCLVSGYVQRVADGTAVVKVIDYEAEPRCGACGAEV